MAVQKLQLSELASVLADSVSVFVCCASYEDRCLSIARHMPLPPVKRALVARNSGLGSLVDPNAEKLRTLFGERAQDVVLDFRDPLATADSLQTALSSAVKEKPQRFLLDITTFTHEQLLILLRLLSLRLKENDKVVCAYTCAAEYSVNETRPEEKWLSKGVAEVRSVLGYPGGHSPSFKAHMIVLAGYEHDRASKLIEVYEPSLISLGHDRLGTSTDPKHYEPNRRFHELVHQTAAQYALVKDFEFPSNDPWGTKDAILQQLRANPGYNAIVAPMNTKISTVGSALAAFEDEAIQLCYAQALQYNYHGYSRPGETCHLFELPELLPR
jgi:hypothetical protein